jgi:hypothetical protein
LRRTVERVTVKLRGAANGRAELVGFSRWLNNEKVAVGEIAAQAGEALSGRVAGLHVLSIQDTTEVNYAAHAGRVHGLGPAGNGEDPGLFVHPVIALDAGSGALLGLAGMQVWTRTAPARADYRAQPIEEKESYRWIEGGNCAKAVLGAAALVTVIADRESDIYEEFARIPDAHTHVLTRACRDRALVGGGHLFTAAEAWPECRRFTVEVRARPGRAARTATVALRFGEVTIKRPRHCSDPEAPPKLTLRLVEVRELGPVDEPIHWRLLTTHAVTTVDEALQIVEWYRQRWHIEQLFRTMKSQGLDVESSQVESAAALFKLAALATISALKIMQLVHARAGTVARPATDVVASEQLPVLEALQTRLEGKTAKQKNPHPKHSIGWLSWIIARLGGWTGYASEPKPGPITMRNGWHRFEQISHGWDLRDVCTA